MDPIGINQVNVGRIAERLVSNELEYRGFRVSDLNKEGTSANADLLAAKDGRTWQIQVKGATEDTGPWVNYGFASEEKIARTRPMFNGASSFYKAEAVVLVSVKSPAQYTCIVLPVDEAERAAQLNLDHSFRNLNSDGSEKKPAKAWVSIGYIPKPRDSARLPLLEAEQEILRPYINNWDIVAFPNVEAAKRNETEGSVLSHRNTL